jgi:HSP20 family molecular chaperone IbpA
MTYTSLKQIDEYINDYLLKSLTFNLEEGHKISTKKEEQTGTYFYEVNTTPKIYHLIFANDGSEAGKYYNDFTLNFLENHFQEVTDLKPFDVIETVKERFIETYKEFIEKPEKSLKKTDFDNSNNKLIKLNNPKNIVLKRCLIDELGFSSLKLNGFEPTYNYYLKDEKIYIRLEAPGNSTVISDTDYSGEYTIIKLSGEKKPDKEQDKIHTIYFNNREIGKFSLELPIKTEEGYVIKNQEPTITNKKGLLILEYPLEKKKNTGNYIYKEEDEV